jgi:hypothetical protein
MIGRPAWRPRRMRAYGAQTMHAPWLRACRANLAMMNKKPKCPMRRATLPLRGWTPE